MPTNAFLILLSLSIAAASAQAADGVVTAGSEEHLDRIVDQAAADAQSEAEEDLETLASKYRGSSRETELLLRLSELRMEMADTLFRVVYAPGQEAFKKKHKAVLARATQSLTRLLKAYPRSEQAGRALFLRGKAHHELAAHSLALQDFEAFLTQYSAREEAPLAAIGVADLSLKNKNFKRVISVLSSLARQKDHPLYIQALKKRAHALHVEGDPMSAVRDLTQIQQFLASGKASEGQLALKDSLFSDVSSVAFSAFRKNSKSFSLTRANQFIRSFDSTDGYRSMVAQFSDRLRAADLASDLRVWKGLVLATDPSRKDNLGILVGVLKYELERESYVDAIKVAHDIAQIVAENPELESANEAKSLVLKAAETLIKRVADYRKDVKMTQAEKVLNSLLPAMDQMLGPKDNRRFIVRWNLAEAFFSLDRYESAAQAYRWIQINWVDGMAVSQIDPRMAGVKAIAARYESLRASGVIPKELAVHGKAQSTKKLSATRLAFLQEWVSWIDALAPSMRAGEMNSFQLEANRALYHAGMQDVALERSRALALAQPSSKVAIASAALVTDTWVARKNAEMTESSALEFAQAKGWTDKKFVSKMNALASEARLKRAEDAFRRYAHRDAIEHAETFVKRYPSSPRVIDAMGMACNSRLALRETDAALECLETLADRAPGTGAAQEALRTAAKIEDDRFHFAAAATLYLKLLKTKGISSQEGLALRQRVLKLVRASGDAELMMALSARQGFCPRTLRAECELNRAVAEFIRPREGKAATRLARAVKLSASAPRELRAIWATLAIQNWKALDRRSFSTVVSSLAQHWSETEVSARYLLIPTLVGVIPEALRAEREALKDLELTAKEKTLLRRIQALQAWESRAALVAKIPLDSVRGPALQESEQAYLDLVTDLKAIPAPSKSSAAQVSEHSKILAKMAHPFVLKSRKLRDQVRAIEKRRSSGFDVAKLERIWKQERKGSQAFETLRKEWQEALNDKNWSRVSFFADDSFSVKGVPSDWVKVARAASLAEAGAENEAKIIFSDACRGARGSSAISQACKAAVRGGKGRG